MSVQVPRGQEPFLEIPRAIGPLHVRAFMRSRQWVFTWGRGRRQWIFALDERAPARISQLARHDGEPNLDSLSQRAERWFFVK